MEKLLHEILDELHGIRKDISDLKSSQSTMQGVCEERHKGLDIEIRDLKNNQLPTGKIILALIGIISILVGGSLAVNQISGDSPKANVERKK